MKLNFRTDTPEKCGEYLALCIVEGEQVLMQASYVSERFGWSVEMFQSYDPEWIEFKVTVIAWAEFDFGSLENIG